MNTIYVIGKDPTTIKDPRMSIKVGFVHQDGQIRIRLNEAKRWLGQDVKVLKTFKYAQTDTPIHDFLRAKFRDTCVFLPKHSAGRESVELRVEEYPIIIEAIQRFINGQFAGKLNTFAPREEQIECLTKTTEFFQRASFKSEFLWDAKMRFGKTFCSYLLTKALNAPIVLILTNRPTDTIDAWKEGIDHVAFAPEGSFLGYDNVIHMKDETDLNPDGSLRLDLTKPTIIFSSTQYFDFEKYPKKWASLIGKEIFIIADECHVGIDTDRFRKNLKLLTDKYKMLYLSGTPFKFLLRDKFSGAKYTWSYLDEQRARQREINRIGEVNARKYGHYYWLSPLRIKVMKLAEEGYKDLQDFDPKEGFTFTKLFRTFEDKFVNATAVELLLDTISSGRVMPFSRQNSEQGYDPNNRHHTLWLLPGVDECKLLKKLLSKHLVFKHYDVVVAAGDNDGESPETANNVRDAITKIVIAKSSAKGTITLTCGKLTHGVSIQQWGAVLNLCDMESAWQYFQFIFRIQTPYRDVKNECYVFDFSLNRTLRHIYKLAKAQAIASGTNVKDVFRELLSVFNPFYEGNSLKDKDVDELIAQATSFQVSTGLAGVNSLVSRLGISLNDELINAISNFAKAPKMSNNSAVVNEDKDAPNGQNSNQSGNVGEGKSKEEKLKELTEEEVRRALKVLLQTYLYTTKDKSYEDLRNNLRANKEKVDMVGLPVEIIEALLDSFGIEDQMEITDAITRFRSEEKEDHKKSQCN